MAGKELAGVEFSVAQSTAASSTGATGMQSQPDEKEHLNLAEEEFAASAP